MAINITQGQTKVFTIKLRDKDGDPYDISGFDQFKVCLPQNGGGALDITEVANANGSVVTDVSGLATKLQVTVNYLDSETLQIGERQDIGLVLNNSGTPNPTPQNFPGELNVKASIC